MTNTKTLSIEKIKNIIRTAFREGFNTGEVWDESLKIFPTKTAGRIEFTATLIDEWGEVENENYFSIEGTVWEWEDDPIGYYKIWVYGDPDMAPELLEGEYIK